MTDFALSSDPWPLFAAWFAEANQNETSYPNAMTLATQGADGMLTARTMLMKDFDSQGIVFYTNRQSRKGGQLAMTPRAGICFYWKTIQRQVHMEGTITQVDDAESDAYFATRPRDSQLGAWASQQSRPLESREALLCRVADLDRQYAGVAVPRPPHWGGYRLTPSYVEFWQEGEFRLHDRFAYRHTGENWLIERLNP